MPKVSAILIAQNEADRIEAALRSVAFCDDVVVVDGGSRDDTAARARALGARVLERPFDGFVAQKNFAIDAARHDIVLSLDADEEVTPALRAEIETLRAASGDALPIPGYRIPRVTHYQGREIRATDWYPDWQLRFFDRRLGRFTGALVHESVRVDGAVGRLRGELIHRPYRNRDEHLRRIDRYTTLWAEAEFAKGRRAAPGAALAASAFAFLRNYLFKRGFVLGGVGFEVSKLNALYVRQKFVKLAALQAAKAPAA